MIPYFEKTLCCVVQKIRYTLLFFLFSKLFNVDIYRVCLILLFLLVLLNVITFAIS